MLITSYAYVLQNNPYKNFCAIHIVANHPNFVQNEAQVSHEHNRSDSIVRAMQHRIMNCGITAVTGYGCNIEHNG